jgi:uncharacterized protein YjeT (DUF2065 family)
MSAFAIILILFGLLIAVTRAPLVVAPARTRDFYLSLFESDTRMRALGLFIAVFGAICLWAAADVPGTMAAVVVFVGIFMLVFGAIAMMLFPTWSRDFATRAWNAMPLPLMRFLGALAVLFGLWLAWFGMNL